MGKLSDYLNGVMNKLNTAGIPQPVTAAPDAPIVDPLFHQSDKFPLTSLERLRAKKTWEKVIGDKHNKNSETNHIAEQSSLNAIGLEQLRWMYSRQYNGQKPNW